MMQKPEKRMKLGIAMALLAILIPTIGVPPSSNPHTIVSDSPGLLLSGAGERGDAGRGSKQHEAEGNVLFVQAREEQWRLPLPRGEPLLAWKHAEGQSFRHR